MKSTASVQLEEPMQGREMISPAPTLAAPKPVEASAKARTKHATKRQSKDAPMPDSSADTSKPEQADKSEEAPALPAAKRQKKSKTGAVDANASEGCPPVTASTKAAPCRSVSVEMGFKEWVEGAIDSWSKAEGQNVSAAGKDEFVAIMYRELNKGGERAKKNNRKTVQPFDFGY